MPIPPGTGDAAETSLLDGLSPARTTAVAVGAYLAWTASTWLLEGRIRTLLRPEAALDRFVYTLVSNVLVGTVFALWLAGSFVAAGFTTREKLGFRSASRTAVPVVAAAALGAAGFLGQRPPTTDPIVVANAFAQVFPVSVAEVVVCWVLVGGSVRAALEAREVRPALAVGAALVVSSLLFGLYHVAHSPPFDTPGRIALLTVVSIGTGLVYAVGRSTYAALVFQAFLALYGVTSSLADAGRLEAYARLRLPLFATALAALLVLVWAERRFVRNPDEPAT